MLLLAQAQGALVRSCIVQLESLQEQEEQVKQVVKLYSGKIVQANKL